MADTGKIANGMQVIGSDGGMVGNVDGVEGSNIKLKRASEMGGGAHHFVPMDWVERVDDHVHLSVPAATVRDRWGSDAASAGHAAEPTRSEGGSKLPWIIGAVLLLAILIIGMRGCNYAATDASTENAAVEPSDATVPTGNSGG